MFDMSSLALQNELANDKRNQMIESQRIEEERAAQKMSHILEGLAEQYSSIVNTTAGSVFDHRRMIESATIDAVRNSVYNIFESSLLIEESAKSVYADTLRNVFNEKFDRVLKENGVDTLKEFSSHISKAHPMLTAILESAYPFVEANAGLYKELLETTYSATNVDKLYIEACRILSEADTSVEDKTHAIDRMNSEIKKNIMGGVRKGLGQTGTAINNALKAILKTFKITGQAIAKLLTDPLINIGMYITQVESSLQGQADHTTLYKTRSNLIEMTRQLKVISKELDPTQIEYKRCQNFIERAQILVKVIDGKLGVNSNNITINLVTESDDILTEAVDFKQSWNDLKQKLSSKNSVQNHLKGLKLINQYTRNTIMPKLSKGIGSTGTAVTIGAVAIGGPPLALATLMATIALTFITSLVNLLVRKDLGSTEIKEAITEANAMHKNIETAIETAKKANNTKLVAKLKKQLNRLEVYIEKYEDMIGKGKLKRALKESTTYTGLDDVQHDLYAYESSVEMFDAAIKYVQEDSSGESLDNKVDLLEAVNEVIFMEETSVEVMQRASLFEAVLYEDITSSSHIDIPTTAIQALKEGAYPSTMDFLDDEEKELVELTSKLNKKDDAVTLIKNKVVDVIEAEERRSKQREEEEQQFLNRMSPDEVDELNASISESASTRLGSSTNRLNMPETLFEAIIMNRSKNYIKESVSVGDKLDIKSNAQTIKFESIVLYTIHETFNTLKLENYTAEKRDQLKNEYYYA